MMGNTDQVDTPWSFVIGFSSLVAQMLIGGYAYSNGLFYEIFIQTFRDSSPVLVSLMSNLPICTWFAGCPIGSLVINRYGLRRACCLGGILASTGLFACYFSNHFLTILLCYGIISGLGHGIAYTGFITAVNRSFRKYRTPMTGLCTLGIYLGMTFYSFLIPVISRYHTLHDTFLLLAGISLNMLVCVSSLYSIPSINRPHRGLDLRLLTRNIPFLLFSLHCVCCNLSIALFLVHLPALIISRDFTITDAALSSTVFGISNCLGKVAYGFGGYFIHADVVIVYMLSLIVTGVCVMLVPLGSHLLWILILDAVAAFFFNASGGHSFLTIEELVGENNFADGVGICFFSKSIGVLISGPVAGILFESTGLYDVTNYASGAIMLFGCSILVPICIHRLRNRKPIERKHSFTIPGNDFEMSSCMIEGTESCDHGSLNTRERSARTGAKFEEYQFISTLQEK